MTLQFWDEHSENHANLMRQLERDTGWTPYSEARRWRRRFFWLLTLVLVMFLWLFFLARS